MSEESLSYNFQMKSRELIANLNSKRVIAKNIYLLGLLVGAGIAFYVHTKYGFTFDPIFLGIDAAIVFGSAGAVAFINTFTFYRSYKNLFKDKILTSMTKAYFAIKSGKNFLAPPLFKALDHSIIDTIESTFDTYRDLLHILSSVQDQTSSAAS